MAEFQCSCGENLIPPGRGLLRCWFCSLEYTFPLAALVQVEYEKQQVRPIIKTLDVHPAGLVGKKIG